MGFIVNNLLTTFKIVTISGAMIVAFFFLRSAVLNIGVIKRRHYSNFGRAMCAFLVIAGGALALLSGIFAAL